MYMLKRLYCRLYQLAFRAALPVLPYREPKILNNVEDIAKEICRLKLTTALVVTDKFLKESGATASLEKAMADEGVSFFVYDKTRPNPTAENVEEAFALYREKGCDCLVAVGGGSAMDCAKAVGARAAYPKRSLNQLKGNLKILRKLPTLFAVPTTAGTGSEVTVTAVITDAEKKYKYTMNAFPLIPRYAVLDAKMTYTLPKHMTATTGMDALTHAVEAYIGRSTSKETRRLAKEVVQLVFANIQTAYHAPENKNARKNMLLAAYKAGLAFSKSYVGYIHAIAHSLGGQYNTPHGLANAVLLPIVLKGYGAKVYKKLHTLAVWGGLVDEKESVEIGAKRFIEKIEALNLSMGIPSTLEGINAKDIPDMARKADVEGNPLYPVPVLMNAKELEAFYYIVGGLSDAEN